jgi:biopolymer transport protein ExbB/TolQ
VIVLGLIVWSYVEGVGDISGYLIIDENGKSIVSKFKAGYFSSLNYGIYYLFILPLFFRSVFATYFSAEKLSNLEEKIEHVPKISQAIKSYSSNILAFLKKKYSLYVFIVLLLFFCFQNLVVEMKDYKGISIGWVQGLELKKEIKSKQDTLLLKKNFYYRNSTDSAYTIKKVKSAKITNLSFASSRQPKETEFVMFIIMAKFFFAVFCTVVFFFNINILFGLFKFFRDEDKKFLFQSKQFVEAMDDLISHISLSGFFLTIFLFFRYITNVQKGSFKPFNWENPLASDQYLFLFGMLFIPVSSIVLFTYVYISNQTISIKGLTLKNIISFYLPNMGFVLVFFIYLINFDPFMESQLKFMSGFTKIIDKILLG